MNVFTMSDRELVASVLDTLRGGGGGLPPCDGLGDTTVSKEDHDDGCKCKCRIVIESEGHCDGCEDEGVVAELDDEVAMLDELLHRIDKREAAARTAVT